ncbi:Guanylyl cyclase-activating protein 1 [Symbiodinium microadriaticum]|uniref:Guanylyl cyclase-activating protein 1 n=1 Tax=Symbiodinium microadriaticum TaxID=2951 RepID=A0A1Q9DWB4_SYMMI|nr:Guanylyl cyclase-activating protein 1 [Symbiodinium microadriaticum]
MWFGSRELTKDRFVDIAVMLLGQQNIPHNPREREDLYQIFDSMDFDRNGTLSTGEWAAGLSVFFKGSMEEAVRAVFRCLDANENGAISKSELQDVSTGFADF